MHCSALPASSGVTSLQQRHVGTRSRVVFAPCTDASGTHTCVERVRFVVAPARRAAGREVVSAAIVRVDVCGLGMSR